jgi:hypothetical protein
MIYCTKIQRNMLNFVRNEEDIWDQQNLLNAPILMEMRTFSQSSLFLILAIFFLLIWNMYNLREIEYHITIHHSEKNGTHKIRSQISSFFAISSEKLFSPVLHDYSNI